jgi:hypothetical protein
MRAAIPAQEVRPERKQRDRRAKMTLRDFMMGSLVEVLLV